MPDLLVQFYWLSFGVGLLYVLIAGTLGALSHGGEGHGASGHSGLGEHEAELGADGHGEVASSDLGAEHEFESGGHAGVAAGESEQAGLRGGELPLLPGQFSDYNPFSVLSLMGVLCGFGAGGLLAAYNKYSLLAGLGIALVSGIVMALLLWLLIGKLLMGLQGSSEAHAADMIGLEAEVLIPVEDLASGEIAYILGGTRYTAPARLAHPGRVAQHGKVRIQRMQDNIAYVVEKKSLLS